MAEETKENKSESFESIELIKGQKGNYGWKIRMLGLDTDKLEQKNDELLEKFKRKK